MGWTKFYEIVMADETSIFYSDMIPEYTQSRVDEFLKSDEDFLWIPDARTGQYCQLNRRYIMYVKLHHTDYNDGAYWADPIKVKRTPRTSRGI